MEFFDTIIKRVVSFPVQSYNANKDKIIDFFSSNDLFQLSVLISSRTLFNDSQKNKTEKIELSLNKYFSRAHYNPVPFGTFSSVGRLKWGEKTNVIKQEGLNLKVDFDNSLIVNIINKSIDADWKNFEYLTNPSLHFLDPEKICYYKTEIKEQGVFETEFVEIDFDENTEWLINRFKNGAKIDEVTLDLIDTGFEKSEIDDFLFEIIQVGLIINRFLLNPYNNKNTHDFFNSNLVNQNIHYLVSQKAYNSLTKELLEEQNNIQEQNIYEKNIFAITSFEKNDGFLDHNLKDKILKYVNFIKNHQNNYSPINDKLKDFGNTLNNKFNDGLIQITKIFNPYSGLKYPREIKSERVFHEALLTKLSKNNLQKVNLNVVSKTSVIENNIANKLSPTFSVIFEILICKETKKQIIHCKSLVNGSSIRYFSRFSYITENKCKEISEFEKNIYKNKLLTEINIIDFVRTINIFSPKQYFDYNTPINCSYTNDSNPILLSDIYVRFDGSDIILISKKHKKEIIPRTISAINHQISKSDIFRFLTEFQHQKNEVQSIDFNLNHSKNYSIEFVPRIFLENDILLYPAQILLIYDGLDFEKFKIHICKLLNKYLFDMQVCIPDDKGDIIIDLENDNHIKILHSKLKDKKHLYVTENLYNSFLPIIENENGNFVHEFIASIKNTEFVNKKSIFKDLNDEDFYPKSQIDENWFYLELYCNSYAETEVLNQIEDSIITKIKFDKFFFIRYANPDTHIRVRFSQVSNDNKEGITKIFNNLKEKSIISNYKILPYEKELYRYGGSELMTITETVFYIDSLDTLRIIKEDLKDNDLNVFSILKIVYYLDFFGFTLDEKIQFCENNVSNFTNEFELKSDLRKSFNADFTKIKNKFQETDYSNFLLDLELKSLINIKLKNSKLIKENYLSDIIHMSMNRLFNENQRFNEFKSYYLAKCYLNQIKFTMK